MADLGTVFTGLVGGGLLTGVVALIDAVRKHRREKSRSDVHIVDSAVKLLEPYEREVLKLQGDVEQARATAQATTVELEQARRTVTAVQAQLSDAQEQVANAQAEVRVLRTQVKVLSEQLAKYQNGGT